MARALIRIRIRIVEPAGGKVLLLSLRNVRSVTTRHRDRTCRPLRLALREGALRGESRTRDRSAGAAVTYERSGCFPVAFRPGQSW
ncbi:hypothetical protein Msi02_51240 [Microbispora siamensis]|uniref:Uncharacterized protein n=1 Tax=Microbispora siamensis TaxID=564413 RepID=A0ABQ4GSB1_9ACTN|nr:hypothetical protein Msi02_51240 [Microbispora siamensis]